MTTQFTKQDQVPLCAGERPGSKSVTFPDKASQSEVKRGRLSRQDVMIIRGAVMRSSSTDRRLNTCSPPRLVTRTRSANGPLSRRDIGFTLGEITRSASAEHVTTNSKPRPVRSIASAGGLSRRDDGFTLGTAVRSTSTDRKQVNPSSPPRPRDLVASKCGRMYDRLSRRDALFTLGAIVRSSSTDRRYVPTRSPPNLLSLASSTCSHMSGHLSRRDTLFTLGATVRSSSTDRRYNQTSSPSSLLNLAASQYGRIIGRLSRRDAGFTLGATIRSSSTDRRYIQVNSPLSLLDLAASACSRMSSVLQTESNNNARSKDLSNVHENNLLQQFLSKLQMKCSDQTVTHRYHGNVSTRKSRIPIAIWRTIGCITNPCQTTNSPSSCNRTTYSGIPSSIQPVHNTATSSEKERVPSSGNITTPRKIESGVDTADGQTDLNNHCPDDDKHKPATEGREPKKPVKASGTAKSGEQEKCPKDTIAETENEPIRTASTKDHHFRQYENDCRNKDDLIKEYLRLMKMADDNEAKINHTEHVLEKQDREIETYMENNTTHQENVEACRGIYSEVYGVHKQFMDEATQLRVEHKEKEISSDILKEEIEEIKDQIRITCDQTNEVKERRTLGLQGVIDDTAEMIYVAGLMNKKNELRKIEADGKRSKLNEVRIDMLEKGTSIKCRSKSPVRKFDGSDPLPALMGGAGSPPPPPVRRIALHSHGFKRQENEPYPQEFDTPRAGQRSRNTHRQDRWKKENDNNYIKEENEDTGSQMSDVYKTVQSSKSIESVARSPSPSPKKRNTAFVVDMATANNADNASLEDAVARKRQAMLNKMKQRGQIMVKDRSKVKGYDYDSYEKSKNVEINGTIKEVYKSCSREEKSHLVDSNESQPCSNDITPAMIQCLHRRQSFVTRIPKPIRHLPWTAKRDPNRLVPSDKKRGNVMQRPNYCRIDFLREEERLYPSLYGTWISIHKDELVEHRGVNTTEYNQSLAEHTGATYSHVDMVSDNKHQKKIIRSKINHGQWDTKSKSNTVSSNKKRYNQNKSTTVCSKTNHGQFDQFQTKKLTHSRTNHGQFDVKHTGIINPVKSKINNGHFNKNKFTQVRSKVNHGQVDTKKTMVIHNHLDLQKCNNDGSVVNHGQSVSMACCRDEYIPRMSSAGGLKGTPLPPKGRTAKTPLLSARAPLQPRRTSGRSPLPEIRSSGRSQHAPIRTSGGSSLPPIRTSGRSPLSRSGSVSFNDGTMNSNKLPSISPHKQLIEDQGCHFNNKISSNISSPLPPIFLSARNRYGDSKSSNAAIIKNNSISPKLKCNTNSSMEEIIPNSNRD